MSEQWNASSPSGASAEIQSYLIPAILSTVLCCMPFGVASIIFAAQVNSKIATGDIAGAMESSKKAKMFMFIAIGGGVLIWVCVIILWVFVFGMAAVGSNL